MQIIRRIVNNLSDTDYIILHIQLINPFLPVHLTPKEIEVLAAFISIENPIEENRFETVYRGQVKKKLKLSSGGLSNHLRELKLKEAIYEEEGILKIRSYFFPEEKVQGYQFMIKRN